MPDPEELPDLPAEDEALEEHFGEDVSPTGPPEEEVPGAEGPSDPGGAPEDEGVPDLQDGSPEQQLANDPQQQPVPGDAPTAPTRDPATAAELAEGGSLDERLAEEQPEEDADSALTESNAASGQLYEEAEPAPPRRQDIHAEEEAAEGLSAEEEAVRTVDE